MCIRDSFKFDRPSSLIQQLKPPGHKFTLAQGLVSISEEACFCVFNYVIIMYFFKEKMYFKLHFYLSSFFMFMLVSLSKRMAVILVSSINSPRIELYCYGKVLLEKHAHNHVSESTLSDMESMHHCLFLFLSHLYWQSSVPLLWWTNLWSFKLKQCSSVIWEFFVIFLLLQ